MHHLYTNASERQASDISLKAMPGYYFIPYQVDGKRRQAQAGRCWQCPQRGVEGCPVPWEHAKVSYTRPACKGGRQGSGLLMRLGSAGLSRAQQDPRQPQLRHEAIDSRPYWPAMYRRPMCSWRDGQGDARKDDNQGKKHEDF